MRHLFERLWGNPVNTALNNNFTTTKRVSAYDSLLCNLDDQFYQSDSFHSIFFESGIINISLERFGNPVEIVERNSNHFLNRIS